MVSYTNHYLKEWFKLDKSRHYDLWGGNSFGKYFELPKWKKIKFDLELKIIRGEYPAGGKVPSVRKVAEIYNVGTSTSQQILEKMAAENTLVMEQGIGYMVNGESTERLEKEHLERLNEIFQEACEYAYALRVDPVEIVNEIISKKQND